MATPATPSLPPPPMQNAPAAAPPGAPSPGTGSPSPAQPAPAMDAGTSMVFDVVKLLRGLAKAYPLAAPPIQEIMVDQMPKIQAAIMAHQQPGEPQAPPT